MWHSGRSSLSMRALVVLIADSVLSSLEPRNYICEESWVKKDAKASATGVAAFATACAVVSVGTEDWVCATTHMVDSAFSCSWKGSSMVTGWMVEIVLLIDAILWPGWGGD